MNSLAGDNTAGTNNDLGNGIDGSFDLAFTLVESPGTANINDNGGNIFNQDPQLGLLQNNGGPTQTRVPAGTSPAVNAGDPAFAPPPATDQRGLARVAGGRLDMGAVEVNGGAIQFGAATYSVNEAGPTVTITATRSGGGDGAVSVDYATGDGTATQPADYASAAGALNWADQDTANKTFAVTIVNDPGAEPNETVNLTLANPQGGATLGAISAAVLTVADNDPAITEGASAPLTTDEDTAGTLTLNATDPDVGDTLTWSIATPAGNGAAAVSATPAGNAQVITYTPNANVNGGDSFVVRVSDGNGGADTLTVSVTITAVNDAPSFTAANPPAVEQDAGAQTVAGFATFAPGGGPDEAVQTATYTVSAVSDPALFSAAPAVAPNGTLTYTPAAGENGSSTFQLAVRDSGGTANGGVDTSPARTFTITVNPPTDDGDGIPAAVEDQVPGLDGGTGDGNGDGVPDSQQRFAGSLASFDGSAFVTIENAAQLQQLDFSASAPPANAPADLGFPFGVFGFTVRGVPANGTVEMAIYVPVSPAVDGYFKRDAQGQWRDIASGVVTVGNKRRIAFALTDNGPYDADPALGVIRDPGGPAIRMATAIPTLGDYAKLLLGSLLAAMAWRFTRRRRGMLMLLPVLGLTLVGGGSSATAAPDDKPDKHQHKKTGALAQFERGGERVVIRLTDGTAVEISAEDVEIKDKSQPKGQRGMALEDAPSGQNLDGPVTVKIEYDAAGTARKAKLIVGGEAR